MQDFIRKMMASAVVTSCIIFGFWGLCEAYSGIRDIGFGENKKAVEISQKEIRFFDFTL